MRTYFYIFLLCLTTLTVSAESEPRLVDGVVAYVNDRVITMSDVGEAMGPLEPDVRKQFSGDELQKALSVLYRRTLHSLISRNLILSDFDRSGLEIPESIVDQRAKEIVNGQFDGDMSLFEEALARQGLTISIWREQIYDSIVLRSMRVRELRSKVKVSPKVIRDAYEDNPSKYEIKAGVRLQVIVFTVIPEQRNRGEKLESAAKALELIRSGTAFEKIARELSDGIGAEKGGDWGWMDPAELRKELAGPVNSLKVGEVSDSIEVGNEIYIIRKTDVREAGVIEFDEVRADIENVLRQQQENRHYQEWVTRLKAKAYVKVLDVNMLR